MKRYRDVEKRLAALEAQALDVRLLSDEALERLTEDTPPAVQAVLEQMTDEELELVSCRHPAEAEAYIAARVREAEQ